MTTRFGSSLLLAVALFAGPGSPVAAGDEAPAGSATDLVFRTELSVAEAFASHEGELVLPRIAACSAAAAAALARHVGPLTLDGSFVLTAEIAALLAGHRSTLTLPGRSHLSADVALALAD